MAVGATDAGAIWPAVLLIIVGLLVLAASSGKAWSVEFVNDPSRRRVATIGGFVSMGVGIALLVPLVLDATEEPANDSAFSSTSLPTVPMASSTAPASSTEPAPTSINNAIRELRPDEMTITATSTLDSVPGCGETCYFIPENVNDGSSASAWSEGVSGYGIGQSLDFSFGAPQQLRRIDLLTGWQRGESCLYERNGRPSEVLIEFDSGVGQTVSMPDNRDVHQVPIDVVSSSVRITILDVRPGTECGGRAPAEDTLISEVAVFVQG